MIVFALPTLAAAAGAKPLVPVGCGENSSAPAFGGHGGTLASGAQVLAWTDMRDFDPYGTRNVDVWATTSSDGGRTLTPGVRVTAGASEDYLVDFAISSAGAVLLTSNKTAATSADGRRWRERELPFEYYSEGIAADGDLALVIGPGGQVLDTRVGRSLDGGLTWEPTEVNVRHGDVYADNRTIAGSSS